jgi:hypothetical protein
VGVTGGKGGGGKGCSLPKAPQRPRHSEWRRRVLDDTQTPRATSWRTQASLVGLSNVIQHPRHGEPQRLLARRVESRAGSARRTRVALATGGACAVVCALARATTTVTGALACEVTPGAAIVEVLNPAAATGRALALRHAVEPAVVRLDPRTARVHKGAPRHVAVWAQVAWSHPRTWHRSIDPQRRGATHTRATAQSESTCAWRLGGCRKMEVPGGILYFQ